MSKIYPILLSGGSGTRLWPLSRRSYPKQFSKLIGDKTLFQGSALRLTSNDHIEFTPHVTVTNADFRFIVGEQLLEIGIDPGPILIEPQAKNTAAAILAASMYAYSRDQFAILIAVPSDHLIPDIVEFHKVINIGLPYLNLGKIVSFGIHPTQPATGYGYLELSTNELDGAGAANISSFVEKPDLRTAELMLSAGNFLWNAGIYLFRASDMIEAFRKYAPETLDLVSQAIEKSHVDLGFLRLAEEPWSMLDNVSIDYAIMEKARNLIAIPYKHKWSDLGGWDSVWEEGVSDSNGNVLSNSATAIDCNHSLIRSENHNQQIVGVGLDNIIAVAMQDAVLIANKERAQDVKNVVTLLKNKKVSQADIFPKDHRPWGWFESLTLGNRFQVKRICVNPGAALSLQSHKFRSEHWIVVEGTAKVQIDADEKILNEGQSIYVPLGAIHRLENPGKIPMMLIEVQIGSYLGEDDIVRYEDRYSRNT